MNSARARRVASRARDAIRSRVPARQRRRAVHLRISARRLTARWRALPDFLVIGVQRGGTSSLYRYLAQHPSIVASVRKEVCYFSHEYSRGMEWYLAHFPVAARLRVPSMRGNSLLTFEATPDYMFHPLAPERAAKVVPGARLIALLRNPVERAYSHYLHQVRLGFEQLSFSDALDAESARLEGDIELLGHDPNFEGRRFLRFSYVTRGFYAEQLERWFESYSREQFLILPSERFYRDPPAVYAEILKFLDLEPFDPYSFRNYSYAVGENQSAISLEDHTRRSLQRTFAEHNERLFNMIGERFEWNEKAS